MGYEEPQRVKTIASGFVSIKYWKDIIDVDPPIGVFNIETLPTVVTTSGN